MSLATADRKRRVSKSNLVETTEAQAKRTQMLKGFDTTSNCGAKADQIKGAGYDFVARYLSQSAWKAISPTESNQLRSAGLALVLVYEDGPTSLSYFSNSRGRSDGLRAAEQASAAGGDSSTIIYFAVDFDAQDADLSGAITDYFHGVQESLQTFSTERGKLYRIGVYGSGATCSALTSSGLAVSGWLAQSRRWRGNDSYKEWSIRQSMSATICGFSADPDDATGDYGAIRPATQLATTLDVGTSKS
jgi:hypothetical protein